MERQVDNKQKAEHNQQVPSILHPPQCHKMTIQLLLLKCAAS